jgi:ABC-type branched-subunit amino acid transport system permease subunit
LAAAGASILVFLGKFEAWQIPLVIVGIMLVISAPSMAIAWLKLRKRNLGPILDANGWAVNAKAKMNVPFGGALTGVAALPPGATFGAADKYAEKPSIWPKILVVAFVLWFVWAFLNDSQGRLWRWTEDNEDLAPIHKVATVPVAVQKALDEAAAGKKNDAGQNSSTGGNGGSSDTNSVPKK